MYKPHNKNKELLHQRKAKAVIMEFVVFAAFSRFIYQKFLDKAQSSGPLKKKFLVRFGSLRNALHLLSGLGDNVCGIRECILASGNEKPLKKT